MARHNIRWLYGQLPELVQHGVLSEETSASLREHYGDVAPRSRAGLMVVLFGLLGAILVSGGLILLIAHNWDELSRTARTIVAVLPMLAAQSLAAWVLWTRRESVAWSEGVGAVWMFSVASCLALVDQTYHIGSPVDDFLLRWALLSLPIVYLLEAVVPAGLYIVIATVWFQDQTMASDGRHLLYWPLLLLIAPYVWQLWRRDRSHPRSLALTWTLALCLATVPVEAYELVQSAWLLLFPALFAVMTLLGARLGETGGPWRRPWQTAGVLGLLIVLLVMSYEFAWRRVASAETLLDLAWSWVGVGELLVVGVLTALVALLLADAVRRRQPEQVLWGAAPLVALLAYGIAASTGEVLLAIIPVNLYLVVLGVTTVVTGVADNSLARTNAGLAILSVVIVARFFDSDLDFVLRGLAFIALGIGFFAANYLLVRRRGEAS